MCAMLMVFGSSFAQDDNEMIGLSRLRAYKPILELLYVIHLQLQPEQTFDAKQKPALLALLQPLAQNVTPENATTTLAALERIFNDKQRALMAQQRRKDQAWVAQRKTTLRMADERTRGFELYEWMLPGGRVVLGNALAGKNINLFGQDATNGSYKKLLVLLKN